MKAAFLYLAVLVVGGAVGAFGVGAYNVVTTDVTEVVEGESEHEEEAAPEDGGSRDVEGASEEVAGNNPGDPPVATGEADTSGSPTSAPTSASGDSDVAADGSAAGDQGATPAATGAATEVVTAAAPDPDSIARLTESYQRLARIFSAMKPDEAAPVLAQLDDEQLEGILLAMQGRNAAPILAEMDPERAAAVSRKVLRGNR